MLTHMHTDSHRRKSMLHIHLVLKHNKLTLFHMFHDQTGFPDPRMFTVNALTLWKNYLSEWQLLSVCSLTVFV